MKRLTGKEDRLERDTIRLEHILEQTHEIASFIEGGARDMKTRKAVERCIEIIGEACKAISPELRSRYPDIPWHNIMGMRNILVHEYYQVKKETVWNVAEHKIPALRNWVEGILSDLEKETKG